MAKFTLRRPSSGGGGGGGQLPLIQPSNFHYLGYFSPPWTTYGLWSYSRGQITSRIVGGKPRIIMIGSEFNNNPTVGNQFTEMEFPLDGDGNISVLNPQGDAGYFNLITNWSDVQYGYRVSVAPETVAVFPRGLYWDEEIQRIISNFNLWYGTIGVESSNPALCITSLDDPTTKSFTTHGPFRGSYDGAFQFNPLEGGPIFKVPDWFRAANPSVGKYCVQSPWISQLSFAGLVMHSFDIPNESNFRDTPVDWPNAATPGSYIGNSSVNNFHSSFNYQRLAYFPLEHAQPYPGAVKYVCQGGNSYPIYEFPVGSNQYYCSPNTTPDTALLLPSVFTGYGRTADTATSGLEASCSADSWWATDWIRIPELNLEGILSLGTFSKEGAHIAYGNYPRDPAVGVTPISQGSAQPAQGVCWHGLTARYGGGTGNTQFGTSKHNALATIFQILNPSEVAQTINGRAPWLVTPTYLDDTQSLGDFPDWCPYATTYTTSALHTFGGITYFKHNNKHYVAMSQNGFIDGSVIFAGPIPVVHLFEIQA